MQLEETVAGLSPSYPVIFRIASLNSPDNPSKMLKVLREQLINTNKFKNIMILEGELPGQMTHRRVNFFPKGGSTLPPAGSQSPS